MMSTAGRAGQLAVVIVAVVWFLHWALDRLHRASDAVTRQSSGLPPDDSPLPVPTSDDVDAWEELPFP